MKKIVIILINLIIFLLLFLLLNFIYEKYEVKINDYMNVLMHRSLNNGGYYDAKVQSEEYPIDFKRIEKTEKTYNDFCGEKRIRFGENYKKKKSIIILGCSYAYGHGLKREESFPYLLSKYTKRPVYNYSYCGGNLYDSYMEMELEPDKTVMENSEYFIYVYMFDHINRYLSQPLFDKMAYQTLKKSGKNKIWDNIFLIRYIISSIKLRHALRQYPETKNINNYLKNTIINVYENIKEKNPNAKFIVVVYDEKIPPDASVDFLWRILNSPVWKEISKETDIEVIETKNLTGFYFDKEYKLREDIASWHPNAKAWKVLTPKIAEKYIK